MATTKRSGDITMYKVKPFYETSVPLELPNCMYKTNSFHKDRVFEDQQEGVAVDPEVARVEQWQDRLLQQLTDLQSQVNKMASESGVSQQCSAINIQPSSSSDVLCDMVINADPACLPLSVLVMYNLLCQEEAVLASCHVHSSAGEVSKSLRNIFSQEVQDRNQHRLALTLVWKQELCGCSLMVAPSKQTPIQGEASVCRYLSRLLKTPYDAGSIEQATEIDALLDLCQLLRKGSNKERAAALRTMNGKLGKSDWLVGNAVSLADVVLWSAVVQSSQDTPANVKKWIDRCSTQEEFKFALQAL